MGLTPTEADFVIWAAGALLAGNAALVLLLYRTTIGTIKSQGGRIDSNEKATADLKAEVMLIRNAIDDRNNGLWAALRTIRDMLEGMEKRNEERHELLRTRIHDLNNRRQIELAERNLRELEKTP